MASPSVYRSATCVFQIAHRPDLPQLLARVFHRPIKLLRVSLLGVVCGREGDWGSAAAVFAREDAGLTHPNSICIGANGEFVNCLVMGIRGGSAKVVVVAMEAATSERVVPQAIAAGLMNDVCAYEERTRWAFQISFCFATSYGLIACRPSALLCFVERAYAARDRGVNSSGGLVNTRPSRSPIQPKRNAPLAGSVPSG